MGGKPALEKTRRAILEQLVAFRESFLKEKADDPAVLYSSALAYERVGSLRSELGQKGPAGVAFKRSAELIDELLLLAPGNPKYRYSRAWLHFNNALYLANRERKYDESLAEHEKGIALVEGLVAESPQSVSYQPALSIMLANWAATAEARGRVEEVERFFPRIVEMSRKTLAIDPGNAMFRHNLALSLDARSLLLFRKGQRDEAFAILREAIGLVRGIVAESTGPTPIDQSLVRFLNRFADYAKAVGQVEESRKSRREALKLIVKLNESYPGVLDNRNLLSRTAIFLGRELGRSAENRNEATAAYRIAADSFAQLKADFPENISFPKSTTAARLVLADFSTEARPAEAATLYRLVLEQEPANAFARNGLAWILSTAADLKLHDHSQALELAKKANKTAPDNFMILYTLGVAHYRKGNLAEARAALERCDQAHKQNDATDAILLAMVYWKVGAKDQARTAYERAVHLIAKKPPPTADLDEFRRFQREAEALFAAL